MQNCIVRLGNGRYLSFDEHMEWFELDDPSEANTFINEQVAHDAMRAWGITDYTVLTQVA